MRTPALLALALVLAVAPARADELTLADGTRLEGKVMVRAEDGTIVFQAANGAERRLAPAEIRALVDADAGRAGYVRFYEYFPGLARLEVLCRTFRSREGSRTVLLAGAVHIGDFTYYRRLQRLLDAQDLVLYEGIGSEPDGIDLSSFVPPDPERRVRETARPLRPGTLRTSDAAEADPLTRLQGLMGESLDLTFQRDGIDYDRSWWVAADVTLADLRRSFAERETSILADIFAGGTARAQAQAREILARALRDAAASAVTGKRLKDVWKETFARLLAVEMNGAGGGASDAPPEPRTVQEEVLIVRRNEAVMRRLDQALRAPGVHAIAIFYGAGHAPDFERRLRARGFAPVRDEWLPAWDIRSIGAAR